MALPLQMPRGLVFASSIWLFGSWLLTIGVRAPIQSSAASYVPGVRVLILLTLLGVVTAWPMLRLSQVARSRPCMQSLIDLAAIMAMTQIVIWPLRLVTNWPVERIALLTAVIAGWGLLISAILPLGTVRRSGTSRILCMFLVLLMTLGGSLAWWVAGQVSSSDVSWMATLSPFTDVYSMMSNGQEQLAAGQWNHVIILWIVAAGLWSLPAIDLAAARRRHVGQG